MGRRQTGYRVATAVRRVADAERAHHACRERFRGLIVPKADAVDRHGWGSRGHARAVDRLHAAIANTYAANREMERHRRRLYARLHQIGYRP